MCMIEELRVMFTVNERLQGLRAKPWVTDMDNGRKVE